MLRTTARGLLPAAVLVAALVGAGGCTASDDPAQDATDVDPPATAVADLCIPFPTRDANLMLQAPDAPALEGNREATKRLLEIGADGLADQAPATIRPAVDTYVAAMRGWEPGDDLTADPTTRAAVDEINAWLRANCPPPPATTPG